MEMYDHLTNLFRTVYEEEARRIRSVDFIELLDNTTNRRNDMSERGDHAQENIGQLAFPNEERCIYQVEEESDEGAASSFDKSSISDHCVNIHGSDDSGMDVTLDRRNVLFSPTEERKHISDSTPRKPDHLVLDLRDEQEILEERTLTRGTTAYNEDPDSSPVYSMSAIMDIIDKEHQQFRNSEIAKRRQNRRNNVAMEAPVVYYDDTPYQPPDMPVRDEESSADYEEEDEEEDERDICSVTDSEGEHPRSSFSSRDRDSRTSSQWLDDCSENDSTLKREDGILGYTAEQMESLEKENIVKRLNDDFYITIEDPLSRSYHEHIHSTEYPDHSYQEDNYPDQGYPDQVYPDESHAEEDSFPEDPNQNDPERSQTYIHQTKSSNEGRNSVRVRFSLDKSGEESSGTSTSLKLPKTNGIQRSASVPSQPFTNKDNVKTLPVVPIARQESISDVPKLSKLRTFKAVAKIAKFMVAQQRDPTGYYDNKTRHSSWKHTSKNYPPAEMEKRMRGIRCHVTTDGRRYLIVTKSKQEPQIGYHKCSNYLDWEQEPPPAEDYDYSLHYFRADPEKRIDFILSYREVIEDEDECGEKTPIQKTGKELDAKKKRRIFEENLERKGMCIERETYDKNEGSDIKRIVYVKIHATKDCLFEYAEHLQVKKLLKIDPMKIFRDEYKEERSWFDWKLFSTLHRGEKFYKDEIWDEMKNHKISARFAQNKAERFINYDEPGFFTTGERAYIVSYILEETPFSEENKSGQKDNVGIGYLLQDDVYTSWFPLHDGPYELPSVEDRPEDEKVFLNDRQVLSMFWSDWGRWFKYQPLNRCRIYFGDTVAMYFAWLGFYTKLLIVPALVGTIVFCYDIYSIIGNEVVEAICNPHYFGNNTIYICPSCDEECRVQPLTSFCTLNRIANAFNNGGSVFFAIFISFWSAFFLEFWKRYQITLAFLWSKADFLDAQEPARPEYAVTCEEDDVRFNPITLRFEPYREPSIFKTITAISVVIITVFVVIITLISIIIYKIAVYSVFDHMASGSLKAYASTLASVTGSMIQLIAITVLSQVYAWLAEKITLWENFRTETEYQNNLTVKRFIFEFFNYYGSCFYIAFVKGNFAGTPYNYTRLFGIRLDSCGPGGCLGELAENLAIIFLGKQILNNFQELIIPMLTSWWSRRNSNKYQAGTDKEQISITMTTPWEADNDLAEQENLFPEYLEMVIQYGFATMFVVAFPIAPLFALINNVVEIRLDAKKYTELFKRPIPINCMSIGIWYGILDYMASIAIITNAFVIAFTSDFISQILWKYNHDNSLSSYVEGHLSTFSGEILNSEGNLVNDTCKYWDYRLEHGEASLWWWKLKAVQFIFVVVFEHFVFTIVRLIDLLIPDIPEKLEALIHLEDSFAREMMKEVIEIDLEKLEDIRNRVKVKKRQRQKYE